MDHAPRMSLTRQLLRPRCWPRCTPSAAGEAPALPPVCPDWVQYMQYDAGRGPEDAPAERARRLAQLMHVCCQGMEVELDSAYPTTAKGKPGARAAGPAYKMRPPGGSHPPRGAAPAATPVARALRNLHQAVADIAAPKALLCGVFPCDAWRRLQRLVRRPDHFATSGLKLHYGGRVVFQIR